MHPITRRLASALVAVLVASGTARSQDGYVATDLVVDPTSVNNPGVTKSTLVDPNLKDPWGFSFSTGGPFWISDQASNLNQNGLTSAVSTLYGVNQSGAVSSIPLIVNVPNGGNAPANPSTFNPIGNGPTGQVTPAAAGITTNSATDFQVGAGGKSGEANFIFANLDGSLSAWKGGVSGLAATIVSPGSGNPNNGGASYTGLAIGNDAAAKSTSNPDGVFLYAANQNGGIDVFDNKFAKTTLGGSFSDPNLPTGYTAFNVQNLNGTLYVTYANQNGTTPGGIVDTFTTDGTLIGGKELIDDRAGFWLNQAWGLAIAPSGFGKFGGDLLVGNNDSNGWISAYDPITGAFEGFLTDPSGHLISENGLWALGFGNGGTGSNGPADTLFFTAGADNTAGVFGAITAVPEPSTLALFGLGGAAGLALRRRLARRV